MDKIVPTSAAAVAAPSRLRALLLATFALVALGGVGFWIASVRVDRDQTLRHVEEQTRSIARILQEHVRRTVSTGDLVLSRVLDRIQQRGMQGLADDRAMWQSMTEMVDNLPEISAVWIHDAAGRGLLASRQFPLPPTDVSDRPYFQAHANGAEFYVGERILGKWSGRATFTISRRIEVDRRFAGVGHVNVDVEYYREVVEGMELSQGTSAALVRDNGQAVFRFPADQPDEQAEIAETMRRAANVATGIFEVGSGAAGPRIVAYQRLPDLPLLVVVSQSKTDALAPWQRRAIQSGVLVALMLLVCGGLTVAAVRSLGRERISRDRLAAANADLDSAARRLGEANRAYASANRRMNLILQSASDCICGIDRQGRITFANPATSAMLGYANDQLLQRNLHDLAHHSHPDGTPFAAEECAVTQVLLDGQPVKGQDDTYWRRDGVPVVVEFTASPMVEDGRVEGAVLVFREIAERKRAEEAMHRAMQAAEAASRSKSEFLANMSHEIRTPMNAILGLIHLIQQTELSARQRDYIQKIRVSAQSLLGILNDILDFSKVEANKIELEQVDFRLDELLQNLAVIVGTAAQEKDIEVLFHVARDVPLDLVGDPLRLQQVLINLAGNAVKFTEEGEVVVSVSAREIADRRAVLTFSIRDTGIGISSDQQQRLFQAFSQGDSSTTRRYGGTGLGLAICSRLVGLMGGTMKVESVLGQGSDFHFDAVFARHPGVGERASGRPVAAAGAAAVVRPVPRGLSVLVVDDNQTAREVLAEMAGSFGWVATVCPSGIAALAELERAAAEGRSYDIVLMDWKMPEMDGIETARRIRADGRAGTPIIIVVSAYGRERVGILGEEIGVSGFLVKPVTASTLLDSVTVAYAQLPTGPDAGHDPAPAEGAARSAGAGTDPRREARPLRGHRLLLVEDNAISREVAREILERAGAQVSLATNGREAVERVAAGSAGIDAVLMDVQMPEMDGFEATEAIRGLPGGDRLPIIAMTASALPSDRRRCLDGGMNDHVAKPLDIADLFTVLGRWIGGSGGGESTLPVGEAPPAVSVPQPSLPVEPAASPIGIVPTGYPPGIDMVDALRRLDGDVDLLRRFVAEFVRTYAGTVDEIGQALARDDLPQVKRLGHDLKSVAGNIGARRLSATADIVQIAAGRSDAATVSALLNALHDQMAEVLASAEVLAKGTSSVAAKSPRPLVRPAEAELAALAPLLANFVTLLQDSNFAAAEEFAMLAPSLAEWIDPSTLKALSAAIDGLDFTKAHGIVQRVARDLGVELSTV